MGFRSQCSGGLALAAVLALPALASAQIPYSGASVAVDYTSFAGAGLASSPAAGQLDSDAHSFVASATSSCAFGDTCNAAPFAGGSVDIGTAVATGNIYAITDAGGTGNTFLGIQPSSSVYEPGEYHLRFTNTSGAALTYLSIAYEGWFRNDQGRGTVIGVQLRIGATTLSVPALGFSTPVAAASSSAPWEATAPLSADLNFLATPIADGASFEVVFLLSAAATGAGSRDEIGFDNITLSTPRCGNGVLDSGEACDDAAANGTTTCGCQIDCTYPSVATSCTASANGICNSAADHCSGTGTCVDVFLDNTTVCRADADGAGVCDVAEMCTGTSATCPADVVAPSSTVCRASIGDCDATEVCGGANTCPSDAAVAVGTACGGVPTGGVCDAQDTCSGTVGASASCDANFASPSTTCRAAVAGGCDVAETCTGSSVVCPADVVAAAATTCRASAGVCDVAEQCDGTSNTCPSDAFAPSTVSCRADTGVCDVEDFCTGSAAACPADAVEASGTPCRASAGVCDEAETCDGTNNACPTDGFDTGTVCRTAAPGGCDVAERCDGTGITCPADAFQPSTFVCRSAAGVCDRQETCTGSGAACPADALASAGTVCRPRPAGDAGLCDIEEACDGASVSCPVDTFELAGTLCRSDVGVCDVQEVCAGGSAACPADAFEPATVVCRNAAGDCDLAETCTGTSNACPSDARRASTFECRASGGVCDPAETCNGGVSCPADVLASAGTECRPASAGGCDVAEVCTGSATDCPADGFLAAGVLCRAAVAGGCDVAESCPGGSDLCPSDAAAMPGTACGGAPSGVCDAQDTCSGSVGATAICTANFASASTSCRSPSCMAGAETLAANCSGISTSCPAAVTNDCNPYMCGATACDTTCTLDTDCLTGNYCNLGSCVPRLSNGAVCGANRECASSNCIDGVCCNSGCGGTCEACDVAGSVGTCSAVTGAPRGGRPACPSDGSVCGGSCDGTVRASCTNPGAETSCRDASCAAGVATLPAVCDGNGACPALDTQTCAPFTCGATACDGDCDETRPCTTGNFCSAGVCVPLQANGDACSADTECTSGFCTDGVCCNVACDGQCEACGETDSAGTCTVVSGEPRGTRPLCTDDASECGGTCDGTESTVCTYPDTSMICGMPSCSDGSETSAGMCDGAGSCSAGSTAECAPYVCGASACLTTCTIVDDCIAGMECMGGLCVMMMPDGGMPDGGIMDGDAGTPDAGTPMGDTGPRDSGVRTDAAMGDGGGADAGGPGVAGGCSCRAQGNRGGSAGAWLLGLLVAVLVGRRRR